MYGIEKSFTFTLREDILRVSPTKFILLYFNRHGLQSFEHSITLEEYEWLYYWKYQGTTHYDTMALGFAFEIKNRRN